MAIIAILSACNKSDDGPSEVTPTIQNLSGDYTITSMKVGSAGYTQEIFNELTEVCQRDDIYTLKSDKTYAVADAGTKCDPTGDDSGDWDLSGTNQFIMDGEAYTIKSFNGKDLTLSVSETISGVTSEYTVVYTKK